jgi:uroporphyrinogen-III synthase
VSGESLGGARVALLEARLESELAALVTRMGGVPVSVPALREAPLDVAVAAASLLDALQNGRAHVVVLLTGAGARRLLDAAEQAGALDAIRAALAQATVVCRGPKPVAALAERGLRANVRASSPYTTAELLDALGTVDVRGRGVVVVEHGEPNEPLAEALRSRGASVISLRVYEWLPPEDPAPLDALVDDVIGGRVDAIAFTTQVQARHLDAAAERRGRRTALARALNDTVVTASIGPACTAGLEALGVTPHVTADPPKLRPMLSALAEHLARTGRAGPSNPPAP